jgi:hypothetical protein
MYRVYDRRCQSSRPRIYLPSLGSFPVMYRSILVWSLGGYFSWSDRLHLLSVYIYLRGSGECGQWQLVLLYNPYPPYPLVMSMGDLQWFRLVSMLFCILVTKTGPICRGPVFSMVPSSGIESWQLLSQLDSGVVQNPKYLTVSDSGVTVITSFLYVTLTVSVCWPQLHLPSLSLSLLCWLEYRSRPRTLERCS